MPVTSLFWPNVSREDVHLVPGCVGPRLDQLLTVADSTGNYRADARPATVALSFAANFAPGPGTAGVAVSAATGEVSVAAGALPAAPRLLNFLVVATATEGVNVFQAWRRFHVHANIVRTWLTPSTVTVRQNARNARFAVIAEFDDGTYGNLTTWLPWTTPPATDRTYVQVAGSPGPAIVWSNPVGAPVTVDAGTGRLNATANAGNAAITGSIQPLPPTAATTANGTARAGVPWSTPVTLALVDGPGFGSMATISNTLILPDGFPAAERPAFERLARELVQRLRVRRRTRPYDLLKDRMNYFMGWVESREGGISPLPEVLRTNVAGTRADAAEQNTSVDATALAAASTIGAPLTPATNTRFLLNERDTAFHAVLGSRPAAQGFGTTRDGFFHPLRFDNQDFDDFLNALRDPGGATVGGVWAQGGKDQEQIVVLCRSNRLGGANNFRANNVARYICMALDNDDHHEIEDNPGGFGKDLRPDPIPASAHLDVWMTAAHELAHSRTLTDEYGSNGGRVLPATELPRIAARSNAQARATLLTAGNLDADLIKWRWPRLQMAGVLAAPALDLTGGFWRVTLEAGHGAPFAAARAIADDVVVRFRVRPLLPPVPPVGGPVPPPRPPPSDRFLVNAVAGDDLELEQLTATAFAPGDFPAGSVLMSPVRTPDPNPGIRSFGGDLELVHADTRARINATRNPLNAADGAAANRPCPGPAVLPTPTPATNYPGGIAPTPPMYSSWIVGLYEAARAYDCDVYRPTGVCIMRRLTFTDPVAGAQAYQFCPVCRYAMVDMIDPSKHGAIDADYAPRYPT